MPRDLERFRFLVSLLVACLSPSNAPLIIHLPRYLRLRRQPGRRELRAARDSLPKPDYHLTPVHLKLSRALPFLSYKFCSCSFLLFNSGSAAVILLFNTSP